MDALGDYYFVNAGNELVSLGLIDCNGNLTGSNETTPSSAPTVSAPASSATTSDSATRSASSALRISTGSSMLAVAAALLACVL